MSNPLLSLFTPTHDTQHLLETYASVNAQTYDNYEWVIVPNGPAIGKIPEEIAADPKVRIVPFRRDTITGDNGKEEIDDSEPRIGELKRFACEACEGDMFCELDHDDLLVPGILEKIAALAKKGAGFVFSDAAVFLSEKDDFPIGYGETHGWETYEFNVYGKEFLASKAFPPSPRSLCEVYYAPDHIRCWSREAYFGAGGHDPSFVVGDDHDLICRTYIQGYEFAYTQSCGYLYRNHPGNTVKSHSKKIQVQQGKNRDKYIHQLIDSWTQRNRLKYLDIQRDSSDIVLLDEGCLKINAKDSIYGCIRAYDFLQYIPQENAIDIMNEFYRVLAPGGWLCIAVPSTDGQGAFLPHYKSYWNSYTFVHFCDMEYAREMGDNVKCRFQRVRCFDTFPNKSFKRANVKYTYADLCALKGQIQPGLVEI